MLAARTSRFVRSFSRAGWVSSRRFSGAVGSNSAIFMEELYDKWKEDSKSVDPSWNAYFQDVESGNHPSPSPAASSPASGATQADTMKILHLVRAYQVRGHELANLDPLNLAKKPTIPELTIARYGFSEADLDRRLNVQELAYATFAGILAAVKKNDRGETTLREIVRLCERVYCGTVGFEFMHIPNRTQCVWLREKIELAEPVRHDKEWRRKAFERLAFSERFEAFLASKWKTTKRFGLEGNESMIPGLKAAIDTAKEKGVTHLVIGMAHRGRMNVITNVMRKPAELVFKEFDGTQNDNPAAGMWTGSGDVKYHMGFSHDRYYPEGNLHMTLLANPSHLEAVNTVVAGKARAKSHFLNDDGSRVMPIVIHGDAAFAGQGICYEHMQLSQLEHYHNGGTLHVCCNNQVGFTTDPCDGRSTLYATDLAKTFNCPVFHVNSDDIERVCEVFSLAAEWRQKWRTDVVIDLIGYRKFGHNEMDQPMFTQPLVYRAVAQKQSPLTIQRQKLLEEGAFTAAELDEITAKVDGIWAAAYEGRNSKLATTIPNWLADSWAKMVAPCMPLPENSREPTGASLDVLKKVGVHLTKFPEGFTLHKAIARVMELRAESITSGKGIDWGTAEALAFGSLLQEGIHVRLSGEDVERGTFSHRHAVLHDQNTGEKFSPLKNVPGNQQLFVACNSPLSEYGVLGFDLGYSMETPYQLVLWEAQFGDFVNGAQIVIDEFLSAGEAKWLRQMGLVMLLPHGYDGQGPDHSSCRIERFLGCADEEDFEKAFDLDPEAQIQRSNWQVVNCSTPANYFHVLRRQVKRAFRKPLIVASPKQLLKLKECQSDMAEFGPDSKFHRIYEEAYPDEVESNGKIRRLVWCTGKIYYELLEQRREGKIRDVAICRVEQIHPFPFRAVKEVCSKYPNAEIVWAQEEPRNMGCWAYVNDRLIFAGAAEQEVRKIGYVGRPSMASTAEGYAKEHKINQKKIIDLALSKNVTSWGPYD